MKPARPINWLLYALINCTFWGVVLGFALPRLREERGTAYWSLLTVGCALGFLPVFLAVLFGKNPNR